MKVLRRGGQLLDERPEMGMLRLFLLACIIVALMPQPLLSQEPARQVMPVPLERPESMASIKATDPAQVMKAVRETLEKASYQIDRTDVASVDAKKFDSVNRANDDPEYNRVIIWLERDFDRPLEYVKIYFLWGRYEMIFGRRREIQRVVPSNDREISILKREILASLSQP